MEEHAVMTTAVVQNALKIILKCVLVLFVLLEEQTIVVLLQSYVKNTEELDNVIGLVRLNLLIFSFEYSSFFDVIFTKHD